MKSQHVKRFARSIADPRPYAHLFRMINFYNYSHVAQRRKLTLGEAVLISPTAYFDNAERISIGARSHIGAGCIIWGGRISGRVTLGDDALLGPGVIMSASNYDFDAGAPTMLQERMDQDIVVGDDVWLGAGVIVVAGVTVGDGCVIGAGSVVTRDLPSGAVAVGNPARVIRYRRGFEPAEST